MRRQMPPARPQHAEPGDGAWLRSMQNAKFRLAVANPEADPASLPDAEFATDVLGNRHLAFCWSRSNYPFALRCITW